MQAGRRLVEHVDHAEQIRAHLRREAQPLQLAGRERGRAALEREIAEPEVEQHVQPRDEIFGDPLRRPSAFSGCSLRRACVPAGRRRRVGPKISCKRASGSREMSAMSRPANFTESDSRRAACRGRAGTRALTMYRATRFFMSALCVLRERVQHVRARARERAL